MRMRNITVYTIFSSIILIILLFGKVVWAGEYTVENIRISAQDKDSVTARNIALKNGYKTAFQQVIKDYYPDPISDEFWQEINIEDHILTYSLSNEKITNNSYKADLSIGFDKFFIEDFLY